MEALAAMADADDAKHLLQPIVTHHRAWIQQQKQNVPAAPKRRKDIGDELLRRAVRVADRIEGGIEALRQQGAAGAGADRYGWRNGASVLRHKNLLVTHAAR